MRLSEASHSRRKVLSFSSGEDMLKRNPSEFLILRILTPKVAGPVRLRFLTPMHASPLFRLIDGSKHHILTAAHPSGLSAHRGFFNCRFSSVCKKSHDLQLYVRCAYVVPICLN